MKADLHMHPLCHKYYHEGNPQFVKSLDDFDKQRIRAVVDWNIRHGMDVISITDHDMILPSLYAIEYVKENNLPIIVLSGTEMEIEDFINKETVHILGIGIRELPIYRAEETSAKELIESIHNLGGIAIMSHPQFSTGSFYDHYGFLDGYEYINSDRYIFDEGALFLHNIGYPLKSYRNSDFHYEPGEVKLDESTYPIYYNIVDDAWLSKFR